jgi:MYXO-CTERM domain-containing protein
MLWAMNGLLAWETHLGGFVAGWAFSAALALAGRRRRR